MSWVSLVLLSLPWGEGSCLLFGRRFSIAAIPSSRSPISVDRTWIYAPCAGIRNTVARVHGSMYLWGVYKRLAFVQLNGGDNWSYPMLSRKAPSNSGSPWLRGYPHFWFPQSMVSYVNSIWKFAVIVFRINKEIFRILSLGLKAVSQICACAGGWWETNTTIIFDREWPWKVKVKL